MKKGFTIIELSIVLLVLGVLAGGFLQFMKNEAAQKRIDDDRKIIETAKNSILAFTEKNGRLPTQLEFSAMGFRGFSNSPISYFNDPVLETGICVANHTVLSATDQNNVVSPDIGFILVTNGTNTQLQTSLVGNNITFFEYGSAIGAERYDDVYAVVKLSDLHTNVDCSALNIINPLLHSGTAGVPYSVNFNASGGNGIYSFDLTSNANGLSIDPDTGVLDWNNPSSGSWDVQVTVASGDFQPVSKSFVLVINAANSANNATSGAGNSGNTSNNNNSTQTGGTTTGGAGNSGNANNNNNSNQAGGTTTGGAGNSGNANNNNNSSQGGGNAGGRNN